MKKKKRKSKLEKARISLKGSEVRGTNSRNSEKGRMRTTEDKSSMNRKRNRKEKGHTENRSSRNWRNTQRNKGSMRLSLSYEERFRKRNYSENESRTKRMNLNGHSKSRNNM